MHYKDPQNNLHALDSVDFEYLLPAGSVPITDEEADEITASKIIPPTQDELKTALTNAVQAHLDAGAQALGYDDIKTAATYADEPAVPRFQQEGAALRAWRSLCWDHCQGVMNAVTAGERPIPTASELTDGLPPLRMATA